MRTILTIWRHELQGCFLSPVAYVTMVVYLAITGFTFWVAAFHNVGRPEPLAMLLVGSLAFWMPILVTVVSMRLFVDEKRQGTLEMLLTAPVTETEVVMGKYLGALTFLLAVTAPCFSFAFVLERLSPTITMENIDVGALCGGALIVLLVLAALLAVAVAVSLTTRNQIVAAICTFCAIWGAMLAGWLLGEVQGMPAKLAEQLSMTRHLEEFALGVISLPAVVLYVSVTVFMLFVSVRMLEARQWK